MPGVIGHQDLDVQIPEDPPQFDAPGRGAYDQDTVPGRARQAQAPTQPADGETVGDDRCENDSEHKRQQGIGAAEIMLGQRGTHNASGCCGHDSPRRYPGKQQPLPQFHAGAYGCQHDRGGAHEKHDCGDEGHAGPIHRPDDIGVHGRRQKHEDHGYQHDRDVLLEPLHVLEPRQIHIAHHDSHHGHGQQTSLLLGMVG